MDDKNVQHYRIADRLGAGGMGEVFKAFDTRLDRPVAIKFLPAELCKDEVMRMRFEREARTASALNHPHICTIFDIGDHDGKPFIVMELIEGRTLQQVIGRKPMSLDNFLKLGTQIADAIATAHEAGIIHRDIKPSNIFVDKRGNSRLLDFGLAKSLAKSETSQTEDDALQPTLNFHPDVVTSTGTVMGTVRYMSPEQARGEKVDERSDLFSLGVVLYEMATGKPPFAGRTTAVTFDEILNKPHQPVCQLNASMPVHFDDFFDRLLAKNVADRFQTAQQIVAALQGEDISNLVSQVELPPATDVQDRDTATASHTALNHSTTGVPSIAVLPFVNLGGNSEHDYFGDGLAEELITALMKVQGIHVAARTSAFQFKDQSLDVRSIGKQLNVASVLEGSFRIAGNRIRISANFINVNDGYQLWSDRFDRDMDDVFAVQDELAKTIVQGLELTLGAGARQQSQLISRRTDNVEAYNQYLKGRYHWKKRTPDEIHKAVECFKRALEIDPDYAVAHAGMADCYAMLGTYAVLPRKIVMPQARQAAEKALALDASLAEAHSALGLVDAIHDFQWERAEKHFLEALERMPDFATARYWYAMFVMLPHRRFDEAMGQAQWAAQLDPVNPAINAAAGLVHYMQKNYAQAIEATETALELEATHPLGNITLAWACISDGQYDKALAALDHCKSLRIVEAGGRAWALLSSGRRDEADELIAKLQEMSVQGNSQADFELAKLYTVIEDFEKTFDCLNRTFEERAGTLFWLNVNPIFEPLRNDPRFEMIAKKMNLI